MIQNLERFKRVNAFCALFKDSVISLIWNGKNEKMNGYALFLKTNKAVFAPDGTLEDAKRIRLSIGNLSFHEGFEARRSERDENLIEVQWSKEMHVREAHLQDQLMVISARDGQYSDITATGIERDELGGDIANAGWYQQSQPEWTGCREALYRLHIHNSPIAISSYWTIFM